MANMDQPLEFFTQMGYHYLITLPSQGLCGIARMAFTTGLFVGMDEYGYRGRYCYETWDEARQALLHWDGQGDPPGEWIKYKGEGGDRRRVEPAEE